jgi:hypothetical protein
MCFTLASAYAGRELGPGAFPFGGAVAISGDLATVAARVAIEGCVGETLAAIQASEQLAVAVDPAVRAVLASIAEDEARHAELAWRTIAWALRVGGGEVRRAVADAFSEASAAPRMGDDGPAELAAVLAAHGLLDRAASGRVLSRALDEVVLAAAGVLLGRDDPRRALASIA